MRINGKMLLHIDFVQQPLEDRAYQTNNPQIAADSSETSSPESIM